MELHINGKPAEAADGLTIQDLMAERKLSARAVITELNGTIIQPEDRPRTKLKAKDKLEIVHILGGG